MIEKKHDFFVGQYGYTNEKNCTADVEAKYENNILASININGVFVKDDARNNFWASVDASGNVNISGVPSAILADVATECGVIIEEVKAAFEPTKEEE